MLEIQPVVPGSLSASGTRLTFTPDQGWPSGAVITATLRRGRASGSTGAPPTESFFRRTIASCATRNSAIAVVGGTFASSQSTVNSTCRPVSSRTPAYMAPEQAAGDPQTDHRADLYSFGAMAYELLAGHPPFYAMSPARLLAAQLSETPTDVRTLRTDCPETLANLVMRCLEKHPDARPQQAPDLVHVLDGITSSDAAVSAPTVLAGARIRLGKALGVWILTAVLTVLTAWAATRVIGLPDWVLPEAGGVMLALLPVTGITWYVQQVAHRAYTITPQLTPGGSTIPQGTMATLAMKAVPHVSWRRTWLGGSMAVGGFAALVITFMVVRALGVGPFGSLRGRGTFGDRETIAVADFRNPVSDSTLGGTVAEALRTDLGQSTSLRVLTRANMRDVLGMMQRPRESAVPFDVAREIAIREGAKAVLDGEVVRLGKGYVVSARLVNALDGHELVTFRETASSEDDLITALGTLSRTVRERAGESLRSIQESPELERVSTSSLAALRKYVQGVQAANELGDYERAVALQREAVTIDSGFAMAWSALAVALVNQGVDRPGQLLALEAAYRHRDRLTEMERLLTEGYYYTRGPKHDRDKAIAAYDAAAQLDSLSATALNNAAMIYAEKREFTHAEDRYRKVTQLPRTVSAAFTNLMAMQTILGHIAGLDSTRKAFYAKLPNSADSWEVEFRMAMGTRDLRAADSISRAVYADARTLPQARRGANYVSAVAQTRGQARESLRWLALGNEASLKAAATPANRLEFYVDTAFILAGTWTRFAEARAVMARGLARVPLSTLAPSERPYEELSRIATRMSDAALARMAAQGWAKDQLSETPNVTGEFYAGQVALAERRWDAAIAQFLEAHKRATVPDWRYAYIALAQAYDNVGRADSAIANLERYTNSRSADPWLDGEFLAGAYRRLAELHDAKGNTVPAIENFEKFVALWKDADPELQPKVREAQEKLKRLRGLRG